jgi:hypothetical protein
MVVNKFVINESWKKVLKNQIQIQNAAIARN